MDLPVTDVAAAASNVTTEATIGSVELTGFDVTALILCATSLLNAFVSVTTAASCVCTAASSPTRIVVLSAAVNVPLVALAATTAFASAIACCWAAVIA